MLLLAKARTQKATVLLLLRVVHTQKVVRQRHLETALMLREVKQPPLD